MKKRWFREWGWIYRPVSWQGTLILILVIGFCINVFLATDRHSHSVSDTFYGVFPFIVPAFILLNWVASKTSGDNA
jgi:hypothetical protein